MKPTLLSVFKPPTDLLNRMRWVMLWFNLINAVVYSVLTVTSTAEAPSKMLALVCAAGYCAALTLGFRRGDLHWLSDLGALIALLGLGFGLSRPGAIGNLAFAWVTFAQLYSRWPRVVARVSGIVVIRTFITVITTGAAPVAAEVGSLVGITMASLFPHLLSRALVGLQANEARFRGLVQNSSDLVLVTGLDATLRYTSPPAERFFGQDARATAWLERLEGNDRERVREAITAVQREPSSTRRIDFRARRADGQWRECEALVTNQVEVAELEGVVFNVRDVTERHAAEAALQASAEKLRDAKHEIEIAARIQTALLPPRQKLPSFDVAAAMLPAAEVGGDYFDILPVSDGFFVGVGDVSGHGLTAGLVMLMTQSVVSALVSANPRVTPREVVLQLNRVLFENIRGRLKNNEHLTFTLFKIFNDGRVQHAGAHEDILVRRAEGGAVESMATRGAWLGAVPDLSEAVFEQEFSLKKGDVLLLHTDGVTEARDEARHEFGIERLIGSLKQSPPESAERLCTELMKQVEAFSPTRADDRSLVVARYLG